MNFKIILTEDFKREFKRLHKKYISLPEDITSLGAVLSNDPMSGTAIGQNCFKVRLSIRSKRKGKSGGARAVRRSGHYLRQNH